MTRQPFANRNRRLARGIYARRGCGSKGFGTVAIGCTRRRVGITAGVAVAGVALAVPSLASPRCDGQSCVPGVGVGAVIGAPCTTPDRYIFSTTASGEPAACAYAGRDTPSWVSSVGLVGVRDIDSSCPPGTGAAQSPDGIPLLCVTNVNGDGGYWSPGP